MAFVTRADADGLELRVNFGVFAGREATPAELDELARTLLPDITAVSIVSEHRHEVSEDSEASLHQVRVEVAPEALPADPAGVQALADRLLAGAEDWARGCVADRHAAEVGEL